MTPLAYVAWMYLGACIVGCAMLGTVDLLDANWPNWRRW